MKYEKLFKKKGEGPLKRLQERLNELSKSEKQELEYAAGES